MTLNETLTALWQLGASGEHDLRVRLCIYGVALSHLDNCIFDGMSFSAHQVHGVLDEMGVPKGRIRPMTISLKDLPPEGWGDLPHFASLRWEDVPRIRAHLLRLKEEDPVRYIFARLTGQVYRRRHKYICFKPNVNDGLGDRVVLPDSNDAVTELIKAGLREQLQFYSQDGMFQTPPSRTLHPTWRPGYLGTRRY